MFDDIQGPIDVVIPCLDEIPNENNNITTDDTIVNVSTLDLTNVGRRRPLYLIRHKKDLGYVRRQFMKHNRLLLDTYDSYTYYCCEKNEMDFKVQQHMERSNAYSLITPMNDVASLLAAINLRITNRLECLFQQDLLTHVQWKLLMAGRGPSYFNILTFAPDPKKDNVPFHPIIAERHHLINNLDHYLTSLLQPMYYSVADRQTFYTTFDVIDTLKVYESKNYLRVNTHFATIHIPDVMTMLPHVCLRNPLEHFLHEHNANKTLEGIPIDIVLDLVQLVLDNQYMSYDNKIYRQTQGGPYNSPLLTLLVNIFMYEWQQDLVIYLKERNEVFGRSIDHVLFTWNESETKLHEILQAMNRTALSSIGMEVRLSKTIIFHDIHISHQDDGCLHLHVAPDINNEIYLLPHVFGHPECTYRKLLHVALMRAILCYSNVSTFSITLMEIKSAFYHNHFEDDFLETTIASFYKDFNVPPLNFQTTDITYVQSNYDCLRVNVLRYIRRLRVTRRSRYRRAFIHLTHSIRTKPRRKMKKLSRVTA